MFTRTLDNANVLFYTPKDNHHTMVIYSGLILICNNFLKLLLNLIS